MQGFDRIPDSVGHLVMKEDGAVTAVSKYLFLSDVLS